MTFFYDLNKRLADLASKQDAKQISKDVKASAPKSQLAEALEETDYSAKKAAAGKDIGKPGKNFAKIAKSAGAKYGSKAAGERVAGAVLNKLRHPKEDQEVEESGLQAYLGKKKYGNEGMKALQQAGRDHAGKEKMAKIRAKYDKMDEQMADEGNEFTGALANAKKDHKSEFEVDGKKYKVVEADPTGLGEGTCPSCHCNPCECVEEGNAFTGKLAATPKGGKFKLGDKEFKDTSSIEEQEMDEGYAEMDAWLKSREKEKGTGKFDKKERTLPGGMKATTYTRKHDDDATDDDSEVTTITIKKKGRPAGTKRKIGAKHSGRSKLASKDAIAEEIPVTDRGEYDDEAGMTKDSLHTIVRHAKELESALRSNENMPEWVQEKIGQIKGMMSSVTDYIISSHERDVEHHTGEEGITLVPEKAVSVAQRRAAGIAHAAQKGEIPKSKLRGASKEMAKMDKSELHKYAATKEKGLPTKVKEEGKPDFLDLDKDGNKTEPMKQAAKQSKGKDKKEEVEETTTSGSVATATAAPKASKGMQFGKGVYESINSKLENMISEGMNVTVNMNSDAEGDAQKSITVTATGAEADKLAELLKMAGLESKQEVCPTCNSANCGCEEEMVDENSPDWPTNTEKLAAQPELRTYSGGLNGPKSTGQTTVPVVASQLRRTSTMEENVELERTLFKTWKNYKG